MASSRSIVREIGTAFAVLAIYLLTILAPLHHARATQLDFEVLGFETLQTGWALCSPGTAGDDEDKSLLSKCPASGIGKQDLIEPTPASIDIGIPAFVSAAIHVDHEISGPALRLNPSAPPRAPPVPA
jgi:hypothetical protein